MHKLEMLRHGQSTWSEENRFTGWDPTSSCRCPPYQRLGRRSRLFNLRAPLVIKVDQRASGPSTLTGEQGLL